MKPNIEQKLDLLQGITAGNSKTEVVDIYARIKRQVQERAPVGIVISVTTLLLAILIANISLSRKLNDGVASQKNTYTEVVPGLIPDHNIYEGGSL
ncbi:hypothetical protein [Rurimicrobium arvi]|uniref:Uncharacterized protein n=1 Tax=Rurimicrobium arvi TaxID=2049916 RepID=A0ABP8MHV9_9BACT